MYESLKRGIDIFGASLGIIVFSPIFILTALSIKLDSRGPVFVEESSRVGKDGRVFRMYKFRSMIANAHVKIKKDPAFRELYKKYEKNSFKLDKDPRVTRVGGFIRRTSLDELPQFLNVLVGNMSLVGPRALYPEELAARKNDHSHLQDEIHESLKAKPGITGPWQVSGRAELSFKDRVRLDADYAKKKSIIYDFLIMIKTIPAVIKGKGAQ